MTSHEGPDGEQTYSSTPFLTSALDGVGGLTPRPGHFTPGKETWYPLYMGPGGPQGRSGRVRKMSPPPGFDPLTVQPAASCYTDCATTAQWLMWNRIQQKNKNKMTTYVQANQGTEELDTRMPERFYKGINAPTRQFTAINARQLLQ